MDSEASKQKYLQDREVQRALERAKDQHRKLKEVGREASTSYGHALFQNYGELATLGIERFLAQKLTDPYSAGPHHAAWPFLLHFCRGGPRSIALISLTAIIDRISRVEEKKKLAVIVGRALQDELNGTVVHDAKGQALLALVKKKFGKKTVSPRVMRQLQVAPTEWEKSDKTELGLLVIDIVRQSTGLFKEVQRGRKTLLIASDETRELIASQPPRPLPIRRLPSLIPLEPWTDVERDGRPLVTARKPMDLSHITQKTCEVQIEVVNHLEGQAMRVDPWMVEVQRKAWDAGLPVFGVSREPDPHSRELNQGAKRARVEETIRQGEEIAGRPIWFEHDLCFRGRLYTGARMVGWQGPDHSKALIDFDQGQRCDDIEIVLQAAAGHYGLGRSTWDERLQWGKQNLHLLAAIAQDPLDRIDLWKGADDPWQLLQVARAVCSWLHDPAVKLRTPIRLDQSCSGMGIIACLTRDRELARLTNCIGDRREDLYAQVAGDLMQILQRDLEGFDPRYAQMAETWLKHEINRDLAKGPTMTQIYGARHFGIVEQLVNWLMEKNPGVEVANWDRAYTWPSQYLAHRLNIVIGARLRSCVNLETWLRQVSRTCCKQQQRIRFFTPMGFPVSLGSELETNKRTATLMNGSKAWKTIDDAPLEGEISARATSRGITANVVHAMDGSFCSAVVHRMHRAGAQVITNHDCFATTPHHAPMMQQLLMNELRDHYKPNWLDDIHDQVSYHAGVDLPVPPFVNTLCEGEIGSNAYCFS